MPEVETYPFLNKKSKSLRYNQLSLTGDNDNRPRFEIRSSLFKSRALNQHIKITSR